PSMLQAKQAKDITVEFYSLSKTFNMTGWRIGWACGNKDVIAALAQVKSNIDSGIFQAVQIAAVEALNMDWAHLAGLKKLYQNRRDILCQGLNDIGWEAKKPKATFYVWAKLPKGYSDSIKFAQLLLDKADLVVTPGIGFGPSGKKYVRMALTVDEERLKEAIARIKRTI
ncbi:MAG: aminotransferase class I/II-fold pyridoxal phosphate-dependent enzyme, partial [Candidatus Omnitrophica bacterium]|nr:aminotransferase class I/II-fold pyridoxal phosphate-dependent enzyme [Candidatus Omnitrophota bacterium]